MAEQKVKIQSIVDGQLPGFVSNDFPLVGEFLKQYYISQEFQGSANDLIQNIDDYLKLDNLTNTVSSTITTQDIDFVQTSISVGAPNFTRGFPNRYGLIKIGNEIITYTSKTSTSFEGCIRGFSGVTSLEGTNTPDQLVFSTSSSEEHSSGATVENLSVLFLNEFLRKVKQQFSPGFEDRTLYSGLNQNLFVKQSTDFYDSKGTDESFKILFGALYGEKVQVIKPRDFLFRPSDAGYRITKDLVVEVLQGDPTELLNQTINQDAYSKYGIGQAYGSVTNVEIIPTNSQTYYKLSLDYDFDKDINVQGSIYGNFSVHPKTKIVTRVISGSSTIDVDSTLGFPESGSLVVTSENGSELTITYSSKSINQFYGVSGVSDSIAAAQDIRLDVFAYGYSGVSTSSQIKIRIGSVLSDLVIPEKTKYFSTKDTAKVQSLGIIKNTPRTQNWFLNIANKFEVFNITLQDLSDYSYRVTTYAQHNFRIGDQIFVRDNLSNESSSIITDVANSTSFTIRGQGPLSTSRRYTVQKKISKVTSSAVPTMGQYTANVQNVYNKFNGNTLVASNSIPYHNQILNFSLKEYTLSGSYSGDTFTLTTNTDHGYYTGDSVYYRPFTITPESTNDDGITTPAVISKFSNLDEGVYFVYRVSSTDIKLASSRSNLFNQSYISVSGIVTSNTLEYYNYTDKTVLPQQILREIQDPVDESGVYDTLPGSTGILVDGVEILNYKSQENIFYGSIESLDVTSPGSNYDIISPPILTIEDSVGTGATGIVNVLGNLKRIDILDPGFDYVSDPIISISGGNGVGAKAQAKLVSIDHSTNFVSDASSAYIDLTNNTIGFSTFHKFRNAEDVIYKTDGQQAIAGLVTNSKYYVSVVGLTTVKLHNTFNDAVSGINTVDLTSYGVGVHRLQSVNKKRIVSEIIVSNPGSGYENKERTTSSVGINTSSNTINILNHGYNSGEILTYSTTGTEITGLSTSKTYVVTKVTDDSFKLSSVGIGSTLKYFYYDNSDYVDLKSSGSGVHSFNYEPIQVRIFGNIGLTTSTNLNFQCQIQPVFRGSIESVHLSSLGSSYGSSNIINYNRQPLVTVSSGSGAEAIPIILDGRIVEVLITKPGSGYNSAPDITVQGNGNYAKLVPVVSNGQLTEIKVIKSGAGYDSNSTSLVITSSGTGVEFLSNIQKWTVNLFAKNSNIVREDDGVIKQSLNSDYELQYSYLYAPRKLRESVYAKSIDNTTLYGIYDLQKSGLQEINSTQHSPIIGWAYDGNPIYGPYGLSNNSGGTIRALRSGYESIVKSNRPPISEYPLGFFVEDYEFKNSGDLDEHNGRFCITPDFPNGVYAYFATINTGSVNSSGPFENYKEPVFPYLIGNSFKSKPNNFNFDKDSNQSNYDLNSSSWFRNILQYNISKDNSGYDFIFDPDSVKSQSADIQSIVIGSVDSIDIVGSGDNYKVNDRVVFDNEFTGGLGASAKVSEILGKEVNQISVATTTIDNVELVPYGTLGNFIAFSENPHELINNERVNLSGFNTSVNSLYGSYNIGVRSDIFVLNVGVGTTGVTGIVTYFNLVGNLNFPYIRENDILSVESEEVKVLNIDKLNSRVRVLRESSSTVGASHTASTQIYSKPRKFRFTNNLVLDTQFNYNKQLYFNPSESVALGSSAGVGIGTTLHFSNPGAGISEIFVPSRTIYLPGHELQTGDSLVYSNGGGSSISVSTDGSSSFNLQDQEIVYAAKINNNLIGISTIKVGIGSTGSFVSIGSTYSDILYFTGTGSGVVHSFTTQKNNVVTSLVTKNEVTVSTAETHGLSLGDQVSVSVLSSKLKTVTVKYNDYNRRIIINPISFVSGNVDVTNNTITLVNHGLNTGDKIIHTSTSPSGGLVNNQIYYVIYDTKDKIKLAETLYGAKEEYPNAINITSASSGEISLINPKINLYKNNTVKFDVSDSSLSSLQGSTLYSAFLLNFYTDSEFTQIFNSTKSSNTFEVSRTGRVGIDTTAAVTLTINENVPKSLWYEFSVVNENFISTPKKEIIIDNEVNNYNQLSIVDSAYTGSYAISGVGTTTFNYNLIVSPEESSYLSTEATLTYKTKSLTASGGISSVRVEYGGRGYRVVPGISSITSLNGSGAVLEPSSVNVGSISSTTINDIGFDYPTDKTLRPVANLPEILKIEPLASFEYIGISSGGKNYSIAPNLVVVDGNTKKVVPDVDLRYELGDNEVRIVKNTYGIYNTTPRIVPINNTNGIGISTVTYNSSTKDVTVSLSTAFSDPGDFPFEVGDKVLIENISVGLNSDGKGYNSSGYDYELFTLTAVNASLGGNVGVVTFNLDGFLSSSEYPGIFNPRFSSGTIVPEKYFPIFNPSLKKNDFLNGESVISGNKSGIVESWNNKIEIIKVSTKDEIEVGEILIGETSNTRGSVKFKLNFDSFFNTDSSSIVKKGWETDAGFLNDNIQRLPDNNYYQYFSYSLKSRVPLETWENAVSSLNHTSGFLKFSDLVVESRDDLFAGVFADDSGVEVVTDLISEQNLNCVNDFDLVTENGFFAGSRLISDEIYFKTRTLTDYFESIGNRVLKIDDISLQFNSDPRSTPFSIIDTFDLSIRSRKLLTYVRDKRFKQERQFLIVSLLHDNSLGYLNQYARVETYPDLGSFDFTISGTEGSLLFYPIKYTVNDYDVSYVSFDLRDQISGIGSTSLSLGDVVNIGITTSSVPSGTSSAINVVGIASTNRSAKVLVEIGGTDGSYYEYDELNILHNGSEIDVLEYGQLTDTSVTSFSSSGLGTYYAYYSGSNINIDLIPDSPLPVGFEINAFTVSIASTLSVGVGTETLNTGLLDSRYTGIGSTSSPTENVIAEYYKDLVDSENDYSTAYYIVSVEDTTNNRYQMSEVVVIDDSTTPSITEYGILESHTGLGTVGAAVSTSSTQLFFTPIPDIDVEVRVFQVALRLVDTSSSTTSVGGLVSGYGSYSGTFSDVKRSFDLNYKQDPIFKVSFDGSNTSIANTSDNTITLGNHFFVTGEQVTYGYNGTSGGAIGIGSTFIVGIGTTDKMPSSVFVVKIDESKIKLAASAQDALNVVPNVLDLTSVGIGTSHSLTSTNQNAKALILIDNYIQSPVVGSSVTTTLAIENLVTDDVLTFSGISSFFGGDLIKVDDEIMLIQSVGLGSTNVILVNRPWMGTGISSHSAGSLVRKISGNYNIVDNTIHFVEAPQGPTPIGSTTNPPNERDWTGITTFSKFQGRTFIRSGVVNSSNETYYKNIIFDDISSEFTGIAKTFTLKSEQQNVTGVSTSDGIILVNGIFQAPQGTQSYSGDYDLSENVGVTSITFSGSISSVSYDPNASSIPVGGVIVSVASTAGFAYQPLVSAGGTATVSIAGTISAISIGNSGSGYRAGIQTIVNVGVATSSTGTPNIEFIGTATVSNGNIVSVAITNPGSGYTSTNPPIVIFDDPLSYSDIPLVYSSTSTSGLGTSATIDIVVGQGSSVIDFTIKNTGYGYGQGEVLTFDIGGTVGIPTDTSKTYDEFQITIDKTFSDNFSGWTVGDFQVLDRFDDLFDGETRSFQLRLNDSPVTIRARNGSPIDVDAVLLIFINDILQVPGESYTFNGGSIITFSEAPKGPISGFTNGGDTSKVIFYKGTGDVDVIFADVLETVKVGDNLTIKGDSDLCENSTDQEERLVTRINSTDTVETNAYSGPGIDNDPDCARPVTWCRQTEDKVINGSFVNKSRVLYESLINPTTIGIQSVGIGSTVVFVQSIKPFFDANNENTTTSARQTVYFVSQDQKVGASATAIVSTAGTITSISISDGGVGYTTAPTVTIGNPVGLGSTQRASASSTISNGSVTTITITSPGTGYTTTNPPQVLIEVSPTTVETNVSSTYSGDFGVVVGISTVSVGVASTGIKFDLLVPSDSFLRDSSIVGTAITVSGIQTNYYFTVYNSNVGNGVTSLYQDGSVLGIGTQFLDNVYEVASVSIAQTEAPGYGTTTVAQVVVSVSDYNSLSGIGYSEFFGQYSWGKIDLGTRIDPIELNSYTLNGISGLSTSFVVTRLSPLKYLDYSS